MTLAPKKTLILHIGMGKTGTTAVQKAFWKNRAALARAGIAYPSIGATAGAHHLISPHVLPHLSHRAPWRRFLAPSEWVPKVASLRQPRVFMSSELISSATPEAVAAFCAALTPVFDLRICVYLRRQDDMIAAVYAQGVRGGIQRRPLATVFDGRLAHYDYMDRLAPWEAALGRDRIIVRPYERSQFHHGDLIRDLALHALGLDDLPPRFVHDPAADHNTRLSIPAMEFKRLVNILIPDRSLSRPYIAPLLTCPPDPKGAHLLGRSDRDRLIAHFAASNARVAQTWLGRPAGDLFRDPLPATAPDMAPHPSPADLRAVAGQLGHEDPGLLHDLVEVVAASQTASPGQKAAADTLAAAFDGLALPPQPLRRRLAAMFGRTTRPLPTAAAPVPAATVPRPLPPPGAVAAAAVLPLPAPTPQRMLVHFGIHKTGTSSIQVTLFHNADRLGDCRYLAFGRANSSPLLQQLFVAPATGSATAQAILRRRFDAALAAAAPAPRAILSAEAICHLDAPGLAGLSTALTVHGAELSFLGYLRDPVSYTRSALQERLKGQYHASLPFLPGAPLTKDYHLIIDRLDALAGRDAVQVFPFDRTLFPQGDVVRHFLDRAGIDPELLTLHRVNDSLSMTAVKALYAYRRLRAPRDAAIGSPTTRDAFVARLATLDGPPFLFAPEIDARIATANIHILDWSEARLGHRLTLPAPTATGGIRDEADMLTFTDAELARIAALARADGLPGLPAGLATDTADTTTAQAVADLLHALRLKAAGAA